MTISYVRYSVRVVGVKQRCRKVSVTHHKLVNSTDKLPKLLAEVIPAVITEAKDVAHHYYKSVERVELHATKYTFDNDIETTIILDPEWSSVWFLCSDY